MRIALGFLSVVLFYAGCVDYGDSTPQFKAFCLDFESSAPMPGCKVLALDNDTGEPLPGKVAVADDDGVVEFNGLPEGYVGLKAEGYLGESEDTCLFNILSDGQDQEIYLVSYNTVVVSLALAEVNWDREKGMVAGSLLWFDGEIEGKGQNIGCATVKTDPESGDVFYFNDGGLPITPDKRSDTNPNNAFYLFFNINPGPVTLRAFIGTTEIGQTHFVSIANSVCLSDIKVNPDNSDFTSNPMPAGCQ